jgi:UPF0176 protein
MRRLFKPAPGLRPGPQDGINMTQIVVCALYKFVSLDDYEAMRQPLHNVMEAQGVRGTLLLAREGVNGTVAGTRQAIDTLLDWLRSDARLEDLSYKESFSDAMPFYRTKVKLKKEIVTMGIEGIDPLRVVGTYVKPRDWNSLIADPDVVVIDTRNDYEVQIGTFQRALNPQIKTFREFPDFVKDNLDPSRHPRVAMFCTGGIRCEKSTAYLKEQGFDAVYHLEGGILKYLEEVPQEESLWQGECFVFDNRVTVNHDLAKGSFDQCHACRMPITADDMASEQYMAGTSCPHCFDRLTAEQRQRYAQRELQVRLAHQRGEAHLGADAALAIKKRKDAKQAQRERQAQPLS